MSETITGGLTLTIPTLGQVNWDQVIKTGAYVPISSHDHTGGGKGVQIGSAALQNDAVDDTKIKLRNNQYLRARNAAGTADINVLRVNSSDQVELGISINGSAIANDSIDDSKIRLRSQQWLRSRNAAGSADLAILQTDSANNTVINAASTNLLRLCVNGSAIWDVDGGSNALFGNGLLPLILSTRNDAVISMQAGTDSLGGVIALYGSTASNPGRIDLASGVNGGSIFITARASSSFVQISTANTVKWTFSALGNLIPAAADSYAIGSRSDFVESGVNKAVRYLICQQVLSPDNLTGLTLGGAGGSFGQLFISPVGQGTLQCGGALNFSDIGATVPVGGAALYNAFGALKYKGGSGTITTLAPA